MGHDWFIRPDTTRLELSDGQWLIVKKRLNTGEEREYLRRGKRQYADGLVTLDELNLGLSLVLSYLLDWSLTDAEGKPVAIRGVSPDELTAAIDNLDPARFTEIKRAIQAHEDAMTAERNAEKNGQGGASVSSLTSTSPSVAIGPMSTSHS